MAGDSEGATTAGGDTGDDAENDPLYDEAQLFEDSGSDLVVNTSPEKLRLPGRQGSSQHLPGMAQGRLSFQQSLDRAQFQQGFGGFQVYGQMQAQQQRRPSEN